MTIFSDDEKSEKIFPN